MMLSTVIIMLFIGRFRTVPLFRSRRIRIAFFFILMYINLRDKLAWLPIGSICGIWHQFHRPDQKWGKFQDGELGCPACRPSVRGWRMLNGSNNRYPWFLKFKWYIFMLTLLFSRANSQLNHWPWLQVQITVPTKKNLDVFDWPR